MTFAEWKQNANFKISSIWLSTGHLTPKSHGWILFKQWVPATFSPTISAYSSLSAIVLFAFSRCIGFFSHQNDSDFFVFTFVGHVMVYVHFYFLFHLMATVLTNDFHIKQKFVPLMVGGWKNLTTIWNKRKENIFY